MSDTAGSIQDALDHTKYKDSSFAPYEQGYRTRFMIETKLRKTHAIIGAGIHEERRELIHIFRIGCQ